MSHLCWHRTTGSFPHLEHRCWGSASGVQCDGSPLGCESGCEVSRSVWSVAGSENGDEGSGRVGHWDGRCLLQNLAGKSQQAGGPGYEERQNRDGAGAEGG